MPCSLVRKPLSIVGNITGQWQFDSDFSSWFPSKFVSHFASCNNKGALRMTGGNCFEGEKKQDALVLLELLIRMCLLAFEKSLRSFISRCVRICIFQSGQNVEQLPRASTSLGSTSLGCLHRF